MGTGKSTMKRAIYPLFSAAILAITFFATPASAAEWLVLANFTLIDGAGNPAREVMSLSIRDGIIIDIDGGQDTPTPNQTDIVTSIDLGGAFVMPGLIDTHVHVSLFPNAREEAERILKQAVRGGVTTVRDLGGDARALAEINRTIAKGDFIGPTVVYSATFGGASFFEKDKRRRFSYGYVNGEAPWRKAVTNRSNLTIDIAEAKGAGAKVAKIYANLDASLATKLIREAKKQKLLTAAHSTVFPAGPEDLVDAGVNSLSHAPYLVWQAVSDIPNEYGARINGPWKETPADHPKLIALYRKMAAKNVSLDATLYIYREMGSFSPEIQADWTAEALKWSMDVVRVAHEHGVPITTGTDWFEPRFDGELPHTHEELAMLVEAGLSPMEAIVAATRNGAIASGVEKDRGVIALGMAADLLVLNENPLADIRNTTKISFVVKDGHLVKP